MTVRLQSLLVLCLALTLGTARAQGGMFVTGHMLDMLHFAELHILQKPGYGAQFTAAMDYLLFGKAATPDQVAKRRTVRIAYLSQLALQAGKTFDFRTGYPEPDQYYLQDPGWERTLDSGAYDVVMFGYPSSGHAGHEALVRERRRIEDYLNRGGKLLVLGQYEFGYLPRFTGEPPTGFHASYTWVTPRGDSIGWRTLAPDGSLSSSAQVFPGLDTSVFRVFELARTLDVGSPSYPISLGFRGRIEDTIFVPVDTPQVATPRSSRPSGPFRDTVCAVFSTPTDSASLRYSLDGTPPAQSPLTLPGGGRLCFDRTVTVRLMARRPGWKDSRDTSFTFTRQAPPRPSALALFSAGRELAEVSFADSLLEIRLTRPDGLPCPGCHVQVTLSGGPDAETYALAARGAGYSAAFARAEGPAPLPGDRILQHGPLDSLIFTWTNPDDHRDQVRRSYPYRPRPPDAPRAPALALFHRGAEILAVEASQRDLEIRLALDSAQSCSGCEVRVVPSGGPDSEAVVLSGAASPYAGTFRRELSPSASRADGILQHGRRDSIVLLYRDPAVPSRTTRRSYPFVPARDTAALRPHNSVARTRDEPGAPGPQWILSDAPGLAPEPPAGRDGCCLPVAGTLDRTHPDSAHYVGFVVEASRAFAVEATAFTNLGAPVSWAAFTVAEREFTKLAPVAGRETRALRLLWTGRARDGARAGTGAYILKASVRLLDSPEGTPAEDSRVWTVGILRSGE